MSLCFIKLRAITLDYVFGILDWVVISYPWNISNERLSMITLERGYGCVDSQPVKVTLTLICDAINKDTGFLGALKFEPRNSALFQEVANFNGRGLPHVSHGKNLQEPACLRANK